MKSVAERKLHFNLVPRADVETRLARYQGGNKQRQATLKQMFADAGCGEHISEQRLSPRGE